MANFSEHIKQAKTNLTFLADVNKLINKNWDWQVTTSYYVAIHLVNSHIAHKTDQHYRSHEQVKNALNPYTTLSVCKLSEDDYSSYITLENLSRRSRYLCSEKGNDTTNSAFLTYDKHLSKALSHLDVILKFISKTYNQDFDILDINCVELKGKNLTFFRYKNL